MTSESLRLWMSTQIRIECDLLCSCSSFSPSWLTDLSGEISRDQSFDPASPQCEPAVFERSVMSSYLHGCTSASRLDQFGWEASAFPPRSCWVLWLDHDKEQTTLPPFTLKHPDSVPLFTPDTHTHTQQQNLSSPSEAAVMNWLNNPTLQRWACRDTAGSHGDSH